MEQRLRFRAYFYFVGWSCLSLGVHVCLSCPNIEIHLPFGFVRIGWTESPIAYDCSFEFESKVNFGVTSDTIGWR